MSVTPAQAGDRLPCPQCDRSVAVPKLGEVRQLPRADSLAGGADALFGASNNASGSAGGTIAFVALSAIALASLLAAGYTGIRWAMVDSSQNTESFLEEVEAQYQKVDSAVLIREYEDMEEFSLDLLSPYPFHQKVLEKRRWGWNTVAAGCLALVTGCGGFIAASQARLIHYIVM